MEQYQIALRMGVSHLGILYNLANAYEMRGFYDKAEEYLRIPTHSGHRFRSKAATHSD